MFYDKFVNLCASIGKKPTPVAQELGISKGTVASWKRRGNDPTDAYLAKIANYFGVSVDELRGDTENEKKPTAQSDGLISGLPQDVQKIISLCQENPRLASALLNLAQQLQNRSSGQA
nr:MAG TPA: Helix-turn-helix XRE-family like protein [Caudoviricetes sp.]